MHQVLPAPPVAVDAAALLSVAAVSHRGLVRRHNEDAFAVGQLLGFTEDGTPSTVVVDSSLSALVAVADGLGGHAAGERASRAALLSLSSRSRPWGSGDAAWHAVAAADHAVREEAEQAPGWGDMATTVAGFVVDGWRAVCFNVGDSRCYSAQGGRVVLVSTDDSPPSVPGRAARSSVVTQVLGGASPPMGARLDPHLRRLDLAPGDRLLACTDGLSTFVAAEVLEHHLLEARTAHDVVTRLLDCALQAGAPDNVTIVVAEVLPRAAAPA